MNDRDEAARLAARRASEVLADAVAELEGQAVETGWNEGEELLEQELRLCADKVRALRNNLEREAGR